MAGQGTQRRDVLRLLAFASAAAQFPGFSRWAYGGTDHTGHNQPSGADTSNRPENYSPQFLDPAQYAILARLTDIIIPPDDRKGDMRTAGAVQAGVPEFIDFMLVHDTTIQYPFRIGLTWIAARSTELYGHPFMELSEDQQVALLRPLAYSKEFRPGEEDGRAFFKLLRKYTVIGFYTSRTGMEQLGSPGLHFYAESPGCPHVDDPEHENLAAPIN
jgi:gluconate 2-dehydrogenase gamma chain